MKFPHSGLYHYCQNLGEQLNKLLASEHQSSLRMYMPPRKKLVLSPQPHHLIEQGWHKLIQPFLSDCQVWHAPFQSGRIVPSKRLFPHLKVVLTVHDLNMLYERKPESVKRKSLLRTQALIDRSDAIVCISEFTKQDVLRHCLVKDKPIYVIHNGINKLPTPPEAVTAYQPSREFLLSIGYVNAKKNFHVLLPLLQSNPDLELIIIGRYDDPSYVGQMQSLAQDLHVAKRLHLLGTVSEEDKRWYLSRCKALVHPSLAEGFGLPVIEAMQFGKPVFLSTLTSLPEVGGKVAYYFPSFEASVIQETYANGIKHYESLATTDAILENVARFDWEKSARHYLAVYQSLVQN